MKANEVVTFEIDDEGGQAYSSEEDKPAPIPESLKKVFAKKTQHQNIYQEQEPSLFRKVRDAKTMNNAADSLNVQEQAIKQAEMILQQHSLFKNIPVIGSSLPPLNNVKLLQKERRAQKEATAGKAWGEMPQVELTEELKADLKALKLRNYIYPNRFYKTSDSKKLPKFFQIGTIVTDKNDMRTERLTKKEAKGSLAEQFLKDDEDRGFSKKKYEQVNQRNRRMGEKRRNYKINKAKFRKNNKFKDAKKGKK